MGSHLALAIHVRRKSDISHACKLPGALLRIIVQPPPFMNHEDPGPLPFGGIVIGKVSHEFDLVVLVRHFFRDNFCFRRCSKRQQSDDRQNPVKSFHSLLLSCPLFLFSAHTND